MAHVDLETRSRGPVAAFARWYSKRRFGEAGRGLFAVLGAVEAVVGVRAAIWPAPFYRSFPGRGWHWVQAAGAYDEHLVRDFGGLSMALAVVALAAALRPSRAAAVTAGAAWEVYSVPHLAYHASHLGSLPPVQDAADIASLAPHRGRAPPRHRPSVADAESGVLTMARGRRPRGARGGRGRRGRRSHGSGRRSR